MNQCPCPGCNKQKPREQYACRSHWYSLPKNIRDAIWSGFRSGASTWLQADKAAMNYWTAKLAKQECIEINYDASKLGEKEI